MGMGNLLVLVQVTAYLLAFLLTFFVFIPLTVNQSEFQHKCLLYASGSWMKDDRHLNVTSWGDPSNCNFAIFIGIITLPLSLFYLLWLSVYLFKNMDMSWLGAFISLVTSVAAAFMMFIAACITSAGFSQWCTLVELKFPCETADDGETFVKGIYTANFFAEFGMAQFGLWTGTIVWVILSACASVKLYEYHKQEDFAISMNRERERLLQRMSNKPEMI